METLHHPELQTEQTPKQLTSMLERIDSNGKHIEEVQRLQGEEYRVDEGFDDRLQALIDEMHSGDGEPTQVEWLAAFGKASKGDLAKYIDEHFDTIVAELAEQEELITEAEKLALQEVQELQRFIKERISWDMLVHDWFEDVTDANPTTNLYRINEVLTLADQEGLESLKDKLIRLQKIKEVLIKEGYLVAAKPEEATTEKEKELDFQEIEEWSKDTGEAIRLISKSRKANLRRFQSIAWQKVEKIESLAISANGIGQSIQPPLATILRKILEQAYADFDQVDKDFIAQEAETLPTAPLISGMHYLEKTTGLTDPREWVYKYFDRVPHWLTDGVGFLAFRPHIEDTSEEELEAAGLLESDKALKEAGLTATGGLFGKNTVTVSAFHLHFDKDTAEGFDEEESHQFYREKMEGSLVHELIHYAHNKKIPIEWLRKWVQVLRQEPVAVSKYAAVTSEHGTNTGGSPIAEDLADSGAEYINNPSGFIKKAPLRFELLQELLQVYSQRQIDAIIDLPPDDARRKKLLLFLVPPDELSDLLKEVQSQNEAAA